MTWGEKATGMHQIWTASDCEHVSLEGIVKRAMRRPYWRLCFRYCLLLIAGRPSLDLAFQKWQIECISAWATAAEIGDAAPGFSLLLCLHLVSKTVVNDRKRVGKRVMTEAIFWACGSSRSASSTRLSHWLRNRHWDWILGHTAIAWKVQSLTMQSLAEVEVVWKDYFDSISQFSS